MKWLKVRNKYIYVLEFHFEPCLEGRDVWFYARKPQERTLPFLPLFPPSTYSTAQGSLRLGYTLVTHMSSHVRMSACLHVWQNTGWNKRTRKKARTCLVRVCSTIERSEHRLGGLYVGIELHSLLRSVREHQREQAKDACRLLFHCRANQ